MQAYSWGAFGREAEFVVAIFLKSRGWDIQLSKGSRGPADIIASRDSIRWFIQVKASSMLPRLKGIEVKKLEQISKNNCGVPVIATLQPIGNCSYNQEIINLGDYGMCFYGLGEWQPLKP